MNDKPYTQVYCYVQRGLFVRHKLVFSLMLAMRIGVAAGTIKQVCRESAWVLPTVCVVPKFSSVVCTARMCSIHWICS